MNTRYTTCKFMEYFEVRQCDGERDCKVTELIMSKSTDNPAKSTTSGKEHYRKSNANFWNGFFQGFFPSMYEPTEEINSLRYPRDSFTEDQKRYGADMYVVIGLVDGTEKTEAN